MVREGVEPGEGGLAGGLFWLMRPDTQGRCSVAPWSEGLGPPNLIPNGLLRPQTKNNNFLKTKFQSSEFIPKGNYTEYDI